MEPCANIRLIHINNIKSKYFTQKIKKEESLFQEKVRIIFKSNHHPTNKKPHKCGALLLIQTISLILSIQNNDLILLK